MARPQSIEDEDLMSRLSCVFRDVGYEGNGVTDQWHGHLFHGRLTHHLGSTTPDGRVAWDTSWVPDQPDCLLPR